MLLEVTITPQGHVQVRDRRMQQANQEQEYISDLAWAFTRSTANGLLYLATVELRSLLTPALEFCRDIARAYLTRLCQTPLHETGSQDSLPPIPPPSRTELQQRLLTIPPMVGGEYLNVDLLLTWWQQLDELVREEIHNHPGGASGYLQEKNPLWRLVGRVTFHLAENKRDLEHPFAFMATFATKLSVQGQIQHEPLIKAREHFAETQNRDALVTLFTPIYQAAQRCTWVQELVEAGDLYHPLAWTPAEAHRFLQDAATLEECGLIVKVPNWWQDRRLSRPMVNVRVGETKRGNLGAQELLDFSVQVSLDGQPLTPEEINQIFAADTGMISLRGKWVEVDRDKLNQALRHWEDVADKAAEGGISFFEGMRLLAGAPLERDTGTGLTNDTREWVGVTASESLRQLLQQLRDPQQNLSNQVAKPPGLQAELRPYQVVGVQWLRLVTQLGLGACLADDMGLGKTVQVIALLLQRRQDHANRKTPPHLLVVPASLIANWKAEIQKFAPSLAIKVIHRSEQASLTLQEEPNLKNCELLITTYGMVNRLPWMRQRLWDLIILDEAQAIKNPSTRQTKAVKELKSNARVALTGTPIENRLGDLWSLFDFINPGLLGSPKTFGEFVKYLESKNGPGFSPLRNLFRPYLLRRLKTDKRIIADLPDKTEVKVYCSLSKRQAALYQQSIRDFALQLELAEGIERRGLVLAQLLKLKQICNHPCQAIGTGGYEPKDSGKFQRLAELCEELVQRQEKVLIFTQFSEITGPLADFLATIFHRAGLIIHGGTSVPKRREAVEAFQREDGPPFFILSLKAGGTGLNLTAANHVIHFDRWWNPAVENQATDRAFRIGQKRNVLVHKFVCRGTMEEKIEDLLFQKSSLSDNLLESSSEVVFTEMSDQELLQVLSLDIDQALAD